MPSSAWCVCRVCWSVEAARVGLCGDPQTSLYLGYPKSLLVTRCQQIVQHILHTAPPPAPLQRSNAGAPPLQHAQHNLAAMLTRVEVLVGGSRLLHIEDAIQTHADPAGFNQRQHVLAHTA